MNTKTAIQVSKLTKKYKKSQSKAVDNISFEVQNGEFFTFLGPNGAGKTTTISILTTLLSKTSGSVTVAGFDTNRESSQVRKNIGIIFQKPSLDENLSAEENVRLHTILYGMYQFKPSYKLMPVSYKSKIKHLAQILGIKNELNQPIKTFSGGMKRKLEIIRSLMHSPQILFLDEPTTGLDPESRKNLWDYLQKVRKQKNMTIFLTTHYLEEAESADKICIIHHGKIIALGTPTEIKNKLVEEYILLEAQNNKKLEKELKSLNIKFQKPSPYKIKTTKKLSAQQIIQKITTPLTTLKIHNPSLERAYLQIIKNDQTT